MEETGTAVDEDGGGVFDMAVREVAKVDLVNDGTGWLLASERGPRDTGGLPPKKDPPSDFNTITALPL